MARIFGNENPGLFFILPEFRIGTPKTQNPLLKINDLHAQFYWEWWSGGVVEWWSGEVVANERQFDQRSSGLFSSLEPLIGHWVGVLALASLCPAERLRARLRLRLRAVGWAASIDLNHRLAHALFWWEWWSGGSGMRQFDQTSSGLFSSLKPLIFAD